MAAPRLVDQALVEALASMLGHSVRSVRRIVIDIQSGEPPIVYVERFDEGKLINVIQALKGVEVKFAEPPPAARTGEE